MAFLLYFIVHGVQRGKVLHACNKVARLSLSQTGKNWHPVQYICIRPQHWTFWCMTIICLYVYMYHRMVVKGIQMISLQGHAMQVSTGDGGV